MIVTNLQRLKHWIVTIAIWANIAGAFVLLSLVAVMNVDVVSRGVFNAPFRGVVEVVIFSLVLIVFLQLPDVVRTDRLTRSDGLLGLLKETKPKLAQIISRCIDGISCVFMCLIAWTVWPEFVEALESCHFITPPEFGPEPTGNLFADIKTAFGRCDYFGTPGILTAPWWPARLCIFFGVALAAIIFFMKAVLGDHDIQKVHLGKSEE